jgi:hypothetical protein
MANKEFLDKTVVGKCAICTINLWAHTKGEPAIWPCGLDNCPYPGHEVKVFERSQTGSGLSMVIYNA